MGFNTDPVHRFNSSIELPASREVFDNLYSLGEEKTSFWKTEYHNMHHTMGARANYFACYAYDMPLTQPTEPTDDVEYAKSIIKVGFPLRTSQPCPLLA